MSLNYKKVPEFFGVGVRVEKKFSLESELKSESWKNIFRSRSWNRNQKVWLRWSLIEWQHLCIKIKCSNQNTKESTLTKSVCQCYIDFGAPNVSVLQCTTALRSSVFQWPLTPISSVSTERQCRWHRCQYFSVFTETAHPYI